MRPSSNIPKKIIETQIREDRIHERVSRSVLCVIYRGILVSGVKSPGYVESIESDRRPFVYVTPYNEWTERNDEGSIERLPFDSGVDAQRRYASEFVIPVYIDNEGLSREEILKDYYVKVTAPFWNASSGQLVLKPGRSSSLASVPSGMTMDEIDALKLIDRDIDLIERMRIFQSRYGTPENPIGVPYNVAKESFPAPGTRWT